LLQKYKTTSIKKISNLIKIICSMALFTT